MFAVLREIGELRIRREQRRGGISLPLPEQEVRVEDGRWALEFRARHPVEDWNEQISLLTGMAAAHLMVQHRVGLLRTLPPAEPYAIERLHRTARALRSEAHTSELQSLMRISYDVLCLQNKKNFYFLNTCIPISFHYNL